MSGKEEQQQAQQVKYYLVFVPGVHQSESDSRTLFGEFDSMKDMAAYVAAQGGLTGLSSHGETGGDVFFFKGTRLAVTKGFSPFHHVCDPDTGLTAPLFHVPSLSGPFTFESDLSLLSEDPEEVQEEEEDEEEEEEEEESLK